MENKIMAERLVDRPDLIEELIEALQFYASGDFYSWEGCHCHGSYEFEKGDKAEDKLYSISSALWRDDD